MVFNVIPLMMKPAVSRDKIVFRGGGFSPVATAGPLLSEEGDKMGMWEGRGGGLLRSRKHFWNHPMEKPLKFLGLLLDDIDELRHF